MKLLVDHRERSMRHLLDDVFAEITFTQLSIGDYLLFSDSEAIIVERKKVNDLISSIRSNRLWDQLLRLMKTDKVFEHTIKRRILLIHGNFQDYFKILKSSYKNLLVPWSQIMGAYLEIIYVYNTPIIYVESDIAFKAFMRILGKRESSGLNDKLPDAKWYKKPVKADLPVKDRKKYILSSFPYIGERLAGNLLIHFNTISSIACASIEELKAVPKIGRKKAALIHKMFHS